MDQAKWDYRYLELVDFVKEWSKDRSTKIGAVIVKDNRIISTGYNGIPERVSDEAEHRHERPAKYYYFEHAERNSIYACAKRGIATDGATMYTTGIPCADCARSVLQAGISRVVVWAAGSGLDYRTDPSKMIWGDSIKAGLEMLQESGVVIDQVENQVMPVVDLNVTQVFLEQTT